MANFITLTRLPSKTAVTVNTDSIVRYQDAVNGGTSYCAIRLIGLDREMAVAEPASLIDHYVKSLRVVETEVTAPFSGSKEV